jgi:hypothetical protein
MKDPKRSDAAKRAWKTRRARETAAERAAKKLPATKAGARGARRRGGIRAWLVTWESARADALPRQRVAAVLDPRLSGRRVLEIVELLYANASYDPSEMIASAKRRKNSPYKAQFGSLHGATWEGHISCGGGPWLEARHVRNLRAEEDAKGQEQFVWEEEERPK